MKNVILILLAATTLFGVSAGAETLYQCAGDDVKHEGVRVNIMVTESSGKIRANLIFGTTVSGTIYGVEVNSQGYSGQIKNKDFFTLDLTIKNEKTKNSNIQGYRSHLKAIYPTQLNTSGYKTVETDFVCGKKISGSWN